MECSQSKCSICLVLIFIDIVLQDANFGALSGLRIVRIATHPDFQSMGYGKYAIQQLQVWHIIGRKNLWSLDSIQLKSVLSYFRSYS